MGRLRLARDAHDARAPAAGPAARRTGRARHAAAAGPGSRRSARSRPPGRLTRAVTVQLENGSIVSLDLDTYTLGAVAAEAWVRRDEDPDVAERIFEVALVARTYALER